MKSYAHDRSPSLTASSADGALPGKHTRSERLPVQRRAAAPTATAAADAMSQPPLAAWAQVEDPFALHLIGGAVQRRAVGPGAAARDEDVPAIAARGVGGAGEPMPHLDAIQRSFGHHDVGGVVAHTDGAAREAATTIGAQAYATGNRVAFAGTPDLHTAAHEAAHVVQQRAGVHLKGGVGADGDAYERHADAVADAVVRGESAAALLDALPAGGGGGGGVQRKRIIRGKDGWREAGKDDDKGVEDTQQMGESQRALLRLELQKHDPKLLGEIEQEWQAQAKEPSSPSSGKPKGKGDDDEVEGLAELLVLEGELGVLEKKGKDHLDGGDHKKLDALSETLVKMQRLLQRAQQQRKGEGHDLRIQMVGAYLQRLGALTGKPVVEQGVGGVGLQVTAQDITAYRDDVRQAGTWAGWAEAEVLATLLNIQVDVFIKSQGFYRRVLRVGAGTAKTLSLLFLGNHYEVVGGVQDGTAVGAETRHIETVKGGDCLFESMIVVFLDGHKPATMAQMILWLRGRVAAGLSDDQIEESIQGMLVFGDFGGLGKKMKGQLGRKSTALKSEKWTKEALGERVRRLDGLENLESYELDKLTGDYLQAREKDPASPATAKALDELLRTLALAEGRQSAKIDFSAYDKDEDDPELPRDRPKDKQQRDKVEAEARQRTLARKDLVITPSPHCKDQFIITYKGAEHCLDKLGQLVPRILRRNCSDANKEELAGKQHQKEDGLYPTGLSPFKIKDQVASGTGNNVIKNESGEMHHVQGHKPSPFMSATASDEDALTPKGVEFEASMTVEIDLAHIAPVHITALYTSAAICYFLLDGFGGDKAETEQIAREEQGQKKPSSTRLAKDHKQLSEKEWQALLDVIRTLEVLIDCMVPKAAVKKEKK